MRLLILSCYSKSLTKRTGLLGAFVSTGCQVTAYAPENDREVEDRLKEMDITYKSVSFDRSGTNPLKDIMGLMRFYSLFRKDKPDVLFNYTIKPVIFGSLAARLAGIDNTYSMVTGLGYAYVGDSMKKKALRSLIYLLYRISLPVNRKIFFQNPDDLRFFKQRGLLKPEQGMLVDGSGVNLEQFRPADLPDLPGGRVSFLLVSRLIAEKGIVEFVEAAKRIKEHHPEAVFRLLGPYDDNPSAIQPDQIEAWHDAGIIEYLGQTDDVRPYIRNASVFVLPSYYREGIPRSILEAMAMGRPIITTDAPGCRETVNLGKNGYLVPVRDVSALRSAMEKFIQDPSLIAAMGKQSRLYAEQRFDVHKVTGDIVNAMCLA